MPGFNPYGQYGQYVPGYGAYNPYPTVVSAQQQTAPQPMTRTMIHADIVYVNSAEEVQNFPVNAGNVILFQVGNGEAFVTKEMTADGQINIDVYPKQPKKPAPPPFDPSQFVTWDALEEKLAGLQKRRGRRQDESEQPQES